MKSCTCIPMQFLGVKDQKRLKCLCGVQFSEQTYYRFGCCYSLQREGEDRVEGLLRGAQEIRKESFDHFGCVGSVKCFEKFWDALIAIELAQGSQCERAVIGLLLLVFVVYQSGESGG